MKKGFTLIELLAVILILGIIALIAIPTVNNMVSEARQTIFKTGNENIMKSIVQNCQTSIIKGEKPNLVYTFIDGKSNTELHTKGKNPDNGYIFLNDNCDITDYYLSDNYNTYSNTEDIRDDYMLNVSIYDQSSVLTDLYSSFKNQIIKISFINNMDIPENAVEIKDPSISKKGKIKSWLVPKDENYELYIGSLKTIYANYDSSFLFENFISVIEYDFSNFNTIFATNMQKMFNENHALTKIDVSKWDTRNVTNMYALFRFCKVLTSIDVSNFNTSNVVDMTSIFNSCDKLEYIGDVSNWDTSKAITMEKLFDSCAFTELNLSGWVTHNVTNMDYLFSSDDGLILNLKTLYIDKFDLSKVTMMPNIFSKAINLNYIRMANASAVNAIAIYLPTRNADNPGIIKILGDKNGLDIETLESKNWNVV